jgi:hypothetical protein
MATMATRSTAALLSLALLVLASSALPASVAVTSPYVRPPPRATLSLPRDDDADGQTPQQVRTPSSSVMLCSQARSASVLMARSAGRLAALYFAELAGNLTTRF